MQRNPHGGDTKEFAETISLIVSFQFKIYVMTDTWNISYVHTIVESAIYLKLIKVEIPVLHL